MKFATTLFAVSAAACALATHSVAAQSHIRCQNTIGGPCGDSSRPREMNCCDYGYCQPWNAGYYQCIERPALCQQQETDIDYYGNDIRTVRGIQPGECCAECNRTPGCKAYTFVNENTDGQPACYLKSAASGRVEKKGAVSGVLQTDSTSSPTPTPPVTCPNALGAPCGNAQTGAQCCAGLAFCQPWNAGYYQCIKSLSVCGPTHTDVDFYGNDIKTVFGLLPETCCDECAGTPGCRAITFVNENPDGKSACYLKSSSSGRVAKKGAVSSTLLFDPPPTPTPTPGPPPTPTPPVTCPTATGASCGNAQQTTCCRSGSYCQPWNAGYYQCMPNPQFCSKLMTDYDYYGNDIKTLYGILPSACCDECARTGGCRAFTFVNENPDGRSACYLKSTASGPLVPKKGALASVLIYDPIPTPTPPPVAQAPSAPTRM